MSADNFNLVRETADGRWDVWTNLSASVDEEDGSYPRGKAQQSFDTMGRGVLLR